MANHPEVFTTVDPDAGQFAEQPHDAGHVEPTAFGLEAFQWVAISMTVLILIMVVKKVPSLLASSLDGRIAAIREQLDDAKKLRAEAEELRQEYASKIANAEKDAAMMVEHARTEAEAIVTKAEEDSSLMVARRQQMAEDKIAAAERAAIEELRTKTANAATSAARSLIADKYEAEGDRQLVDSTISDL
ncbi:hypothetical protein [Altericroceibacterium endophyticum]|uniref:ATP synthase subunit b n=1 Tax=Altericroceibacterium endophyticum TaxID=1808508 RepID=A0A6I4T2E8_9SPHN|nr:hypothetical protein [Altericroceibacterium endophyticum]MXO64401.1 hypothetical protein [Altericroceibacterium endophyticum]